jgi:large subunit ribosomal protein L21
MYAVITAGGRQERVVEGQRVEVDLLDAAEGDQVSFPAVLVVDGDTVLATPDQLEGTSVTATVVGTAKGPKINGFTYKRRTNQRRHYGHRQKYSVVEITSIRRPWQEERAGMSKTKGGGSTCNGRDSTHSASASRC